MKVPAGRWPRVRFWRTVRTTWNDQSSTVPLEVFQRRQCGMLWWRRINDTIPLIPFTFYRIADSAFVWPRISKNNKALRCERWGIVSHRHMILGIGKELGLVSIASARFMSVPQSLPRRPFSYRSQGDRCLEHVFFPRRRSPHPPWPWRWGVDTLGPFQVTPWWHHSGSRGFHPIWEEDPK